MAFVQGFPTHGGTGGTNGIDGGSGYFYGVDRVALERATAMERVSRASSGNNVTAGAGGTEAKYASISCGD